MRDWRVTRFTPTGVGTIPLENHFKCRMTVHPHGRGDNASVRTPSARMLGSPPRAWGQCCRRRCWAPGGGSPPRAWGQYARRSAHCTPWRFTPTGVGTIFNAIRRAVRSAVHPHGRGDNGPNARQFKRQHGSPPRAWGQCMCRHSRASGSRFTPTGVGTMQAQCLGYQCESVHPHGRGDNLETASKRRCTIGSPPRAWGQFWLALRGAQTQRFTPTGVGTMNSGVRGRMLAAVHPHGRGDNHTSARTHLQCLGSPPRAWGQCRFPRALERLVRFTPTGVGTISSYDNCAPCASVHPHGRGDNRAVLLTDFIGDGSPPRAWGQFDLAERMFHIYRFTPTGVGTIRSGRTYVSHLSVHPHGRGDNVFTTR